jgi:hypothetical protein
MASSFQLILVLKPPETIVAHEIHSGDSKIGLTEHMRKELDQPPKNIIRKYYIQ